MELIGCGWFVYLGGSISNIGGGQYIIEPDYAGRVLWHFSANGVGLFGHFYRSAI